MRDSAVVLAPIEISTSVRPTAGPGLASLAPARVTVLEASGVNAYRPDLLPGALAQQPGISLYDDLGSALKLGMASRGFFASPVVGTPQGLSVFLDGVRQSEPDAAEVNFDLLPLASLSRIELVSGTTSLQGPNAFGGVINLVTPHGTGPFAADLETETGSWGDFGVRASTAGSTANGLSVYASAHYERQDGWRQLTSANRAGGLLNVGRLTSTWGANLQLVASRSYAQTAGSLPASIFDARPDSNLSAGDAERLSLTQVAFAAYRQLGAGRASLRAWYRYSSADRFNANQVDDPDSRDLSDASTFGWSFDYRWAGRIGAAAIGLRVGSDGTINRARIRLFLDSTKFGAGSAITTSAESPLWDASGFGAVDVTLGRAALSAGARYDRVRIPYQDRLTPSLSGTSSFTQLEPKAGLAVDAGGGLSVYASAGEGFRAPALIEVACADPSVPCSLPYSLGADPPIRPVRAATYEAGATWARGRLTATATVYRSDVRDEIVLLGSASPVTGSTIAGYFGNIPRTRRQGAELGLSLGFGAGHMAYLNYSVTRATFASSDTLATPIDTSGMETVRAGNIMPLVPASTVKLGARFRLGDQFDCQADGRYVGPQYLRGDETNVAAPLAPWFVMDARLGWHRGGWEVAAMVTNLLDRHYASFGTFNVNEGAAGEPIERFLTPGAERSVRFVIRRHLGPGGTDGTSTREDVDR